MTKVTKNRKVFIKIGFKKPLEWWDYEIKNGITKKSFLDWCDEKKYVLCESSIKPSVNSCQLTREELKKKAEEWLEFMPINRSMFPNSVIKNLAELMVDFHLEMIKK
ncbi:MAG: hypothetical protein PHS93_10205 [Candidatus Omnitrophica bacterium]|nr:hypothetical protein [Candidatus Omnitrophota bacterium]MDD5353522.1 hypothetical protein [Candidatus Omnitrophota bacterium]